MLRDDDMDRMRLLRGGIRLPVTETNAHQYKKLIARIVRTVNQFRVVIKQICCRTEGEECDECEENREFNPTGETP